MSEPIYWCPGVNGLDHYYAVEWLVAVLLVVVPLAAAGQR